MTGFEEEFRRAANPGPGRRIPGAVLLAADRSGQVKYHRVEGFDSVDELAAKPLTADSTFWIASCTKLMTTICALQCVEKGLLALDEGVSAVLPELRTRDIVTGFVSGTKEPIVRQASKKITLRQLLTHSSGMGYDFISPALQTWREWTGVDLTIFRTGDILREYDMPLVYEPGEGWEYSCGIDWAGLMVERVNGGVRLGTYMKEHIWKPLGMELITYQPASDQRVQSQLCSATVRSPAGDLSPASPFFTAKKDDLGGGGIYASPRDYIKVLIAILQNDVRLLSTKSVESMFQPQLPDDTFIRAKVAGDTGAMYRAGVDSDAWNFGLGGILNLEDVDGICRKGTMSWGGLPNLYWWIDRLAGTCGIYASQVLPPADVISMNLSVDFRRDVYEKLATKA